MAQVSYGTITITDTNDIEEIYTIYAGSSGDTQQDMPTWTYAAVTGGTIWKRDVSLVTGDYIWQSIVITKSGVVINATNWENFYNTPICITGPEGQGGQPGTPGKGISNITIQYCNYGSGEPANTGSHWQDTIPTYDSSKPNYWTKTTITYTVGDPFIKKVLDQGITDAVYNSAMANSIAQSANENANGAMSQVVEVEQHLSVTDTNVSALQTRLKKIWINEVTSGDYIAGTYAASGIEGTTFVENNPSTFGYNTLLRHNQLALRYNTINMTQLSTAALTFYRPTTINNQLVQGDRGLVVNANGIDILSVSNYKLSSDTVVDSTKIYYVLNNNTYTRVVNPTGNPQSNNYYEHDIDAKLDSNGLVLNKGGVIAGGGNNLIYLSTEGYPLYGEVVDGVASNGFTINNHTPSTASYSSSGNDDPAWKQIIGTKFGVDSEGNLYARDAHISGEIVITSGETANKLAAVDSDVQAINSQVKINNNQILIGNENSFHILINGDNTNPNYGLGFFLANDKVAYMNDNRLSIPYSVVLKGMEIGEEWVWELNQSTKNLTLKWTGQSTQK